MAITSIDYTLFRQLRENNVLPLGGKVLELGEANWYGDVPINALAADIPLFAQDNERVVLAEELAESMKAMRPNIAFEVAKIFWRALLHHASMTAIDLNGTPAAIKMDLNHPLDLPHPFDIIINLGTAEHVFNIYQLFKSVHDFTVPNGVMIHCMPFSGFVDHGFYNFNPTFYWDLAAANGYKTLTFFYAELTPAKIWQLQKRESMLNLVNEGKIAQNSSLLYAVWRKPAGIAEFRIPQQGFYAGSLSSEAAQAWIDMR